MKILLYICDMKIALIGSSSFLARSILNLTTEHEVVCFSRNFEPVFDYPIHGIESLNLNILLDSDLVVYCAGAGIQPQHSDSDEIIESLNYRQPRLLIEKLTDGGYMGQLITFGSYFEIGNTTERKPYSESDLLTSNNSLPNVYCESKRKLTRHIYEKSHKTNLNHLHLILTNIYGLGENEDRLLTYLTRCFKKGEEVSLTSGSQIRQFTHVDDVARFVLDNRTREISGILNLTHPEEVTVRTVVEQFAEIFQFPKQKLKFDTLKKRDSMMNYLSLKSNKFSESHPDFVFKDLRKGLMSYR